MTKDNKDLMGKKVKIIVKDTPHPRTRNGIYLGENDSWLYLEIKNKVVWFNLSEIKRIELDEDG